MNKKNITAKQNLLIQSLEGIGDILVYEAKRQKNKLVLDGLQMISDSVKKIFNIQKSEPERFEQLVVSQDFLELYQKDKEEAQLRLTFDPEKYLISFSTAINQIIRIYESAIETQNKEVSRFAVYHINWILKALAFEKDNRLFIEQILRKLAQITRTAIKNNDDSAYSAAIHWYTDIVFNRFTQSKFQLSYIDLFDKYFFANINYIVSQNQESLFHALVSSLIDGVDFSYYDRGKIWDYGHIILEDDLQKYNKLDKEYGIEKRIRELAHSENELDTKEKLDSWLDKLDELKEIIETNLTDSQTKEAKELEKKVRDFSISQFKYNNLLEVVFAIGAYCLFKQKPSLIKHLWQYKQPPDSDAHWIGHDIIPETLNQVIQFYLRKELFERKLNFLEGHHGSEVYYKKYFLLLLARVLQNIRSYENDDKYPQIEDYQLPDLNIYRLSDLGDSADEFIQLADSLKNEKNLLFELGFDVGKIDELFDKKLISFLQKIKIESNKQISAKHKKEKISPNKVEEFKEDVLKSFHKVVIMRDIFVN
ncbi:MAG: hypothetical protein HY776_00505 [Actinobacteria bacterium]|nr:hypothetical protein [Actinomycetota bacterium]